MPRISPATIRQAHQLDNLLPVLLPVCRDVASARNELRWLKEHATRSDDRRGSIKNLVHRRARGEPLQYILGTEYFGSLEILCKPGVLIPRQDTAQIVSHLVHLLQPQKLRLSRPLRVLDLCTGTGCIPLLFRHEFHQKWPSTAIELVGVDISRHALSLAQENLKRQQNQMKGSEDEVNSGETRIDFCLGDVLEQRVIPDQDSLLTAALKQLTHQNRAVEFDVLISNPPYISSKDFSRTTSRSVRLFEPKLALVPPQDARRSDRAMHEGDLFYPRLIDIALNVGSKVILFEVGDLAQAERIAYLVAEARAWDAIEIWRDDLTPDKVESGSHGELGPNTRIRGSGNGRAVFAYRRSASAWLEM